jgi:actin-related protein
MSADPYMAYWDALPFQGFHRPDFIRVTDGKYKDPNLNAVTEDNREKTEERRARQRAEAFERRMIQQELQVEAKKKFLEEQKKAKAFLHERSKAQQAKRKAEDDAKKKAVRDAEKEERRKVKIAFLEARQERVRVARQVSEERKRQQAEASARHRERKKQGIVVRSEGNRSIEIELKAPDGSVRLAKSVGDAGRILGCSAGNVQRALRKGHKCMGHDIRATGNLGDHRPGRPVIVTFPDGTEKEFETIQQACTAVGGHHSSIRRALQHGYKVVGCRVRLAT